MVGDVTGIGDLTGVYDTTTGWRRSERFWGRVGQMSYSVMTGWSGGGCNRDGRLTGVYNTTTGWRRRERF